MNSNYQFFAGIDISKDKLDYTLLKDKELAAQGQIANSSSGLNKLRKHLKQLGIPLSKLLICCENTGIYNYPLIMWSKHNNANLWIENAKTIKKSIALVRGKNDKDDSYHTKFFVSFEKKIINRVRRSTKFCSKFSDLSQELDLRPLFNNQR